MNKSSAVTSQPAILRLTLACDLAEVQPATRAAHEFLAAQAWGADDRMNFDLVLAEACNNAVKYADDAGRKFPIRLEIVSAPDGVEFRVEDHTPGFDWPEKIELPGPDSERGRGLYLINSVMDYAGYFRGRKANLLVLRKARVFVKSSPQSTNLPRLSAPLSSPKGGEGRGEEAVLKSTPLPSPLPATQGEGEDLSATINGALGSTTASNRESAQTQKPADNERVVDELMEELSSCYESLSAIFRYSSERGKTADFDEFAHRLLHDLLQIVDADWYILRLAPKGEDRLVVFAVSEPSLNLEPLPLPAPGGTAASPEAQAALSRRTVWFDLKDAPFAQTPLAAVKSNSAGLSHPIQMGGQCMGTLTMGKAAADAAPARRSLMFTAGQTNVIGTFADFLAIQLANARFQEEQLNQRLVAHELDLAKNIQRSLLPVTLPQLPGFRLSAFCRSAREVGGDFYDVLRLDGDSLLLVIADVMGKGIPAAMFAAILRTLLRASPDLTCQPAALLARANQLLHPDLSAVDMFITAQIAHVNAGTRTMTVANAGHCPLAVATPEGARMISPPGRPLGLAPDSPFREETVELPAHSRLLMYTDGLTDTLNADDGELGELRLLDWLRTSTGRDPEGLREELARLLLQYQSSGALHDDQTFIIMAG